MQVIERDIVILPRKPSAPTFLETGFSTGDVSHAPHRCTVLLIALAYAVSVPFGHDCRSLDLAPTSLETPARVTDYHYDL